MRSVRRLLVGPALFVAAGCGDPTGLDVDLGLYEAIVALDVLRYDRVEPAEAWDHWELRFSFGIPETDTLLGSGGALGRDELDPDVLAELDALSPARGFALGCLPAGCFKYVAAVRSDEISLFDDVQGLGRFLGRVGSREEAVLLVDARSYYWDRGADTGVRPVQGGWEFVVFELVAVCDPVRTDRVLLRVDGSGAVRVTGRELWRRHDGACI